MTNITGEIIRLNHTDAVFTAAGASVMVFQGGAPVASGTVDRDEVFEVEVPASIVGEIEIVLGVHGAAPVTATIEAGEDLRVALFCNNQQQFA